MAHEALDFLQAYSKDNKYFLSHPFLWKVSFNYNFITLRSAINNALRKSGESWRAITLPKFFEKNGNMLGAREITIPQEATMFDDYGIDPSSRGGFLPAFGSNSRESFLRRGITINFFESDIDIEHTFFRPWMISIGIDGLINHDLKCDIVVKQYDNRGVRRKGYVFERAFPTNTEGGTYNYNPSDFKEKTITFAFKNYRPL